MTHRSYWRTALTCALAGAVLGLLAPVAGQSARPADTAHGKQLYYRHGCYGCHGFNGETGERRLVGSPLLEKPDVFVAFLRLRGDLVPLLPSTRMPSFPVSALSDVDALDLYAYVRSFVLDAPDPQGVAALRTILESAQGGYKPAP
jgi:mono/diheme cytochrome c family protein